MPSIQPFGEAVMGKAGLVIISLFVVISTFGAYIASFYVSTRYVHTQVVAAPVSLA